MDAAATGVPLSGGPRRTDARSDAALGVPIGKLGDQLAVEREALSSRGAGGVAGVDVRAAVVPVARTPGGADDDEAAGGDWTRVEDAGGAAIGFAGRQSMTSR